MSEPFYFHGTDAFLAVGEVLLPGTHKDVKRDHGRSDHVYMVSSKPLGWKKALSEAYSWARTSCMVKEEEEEYFYSPTAHVYLVKPQGFIEQDNSSDVEQNSYRASSAVIVAEILHEELAYYSTGFGYSYLSV